ncbi:MAG: hypothetical protein AB8F78_13225 [Saprospiraceae bacterium]
MKRQLAQFNTDFFSFIKRVALPLACFFLCLNAFSQTRPDASWFTGSAASTQEGFGLLEWNWSLGSGLRFTSFDSVSSFSFVEANATFSAPNYTLQSNGCLLVRNLRDSLTTPILYDDSNPFFSRITLCSEGRQGTGYEFFLPLGNDELVYAGEVWHNLPDPFWISGVTSQAFTYLSVDEILDPGPINYPELILSQFEVPLQDTMLNECLHYIANPSGGWWGISKSAVSNRFQRWLVTEDTVEVLSPIATGPAGYNGERSTTRIAFRPSGDLFAISGTDDGVALYTFDRETAEIQLYDEIPPAFDTAFQFYNEPSDCAFSACGRYLYVTMVRNVYQFDTYAANIASTAILINDVDRLPFVTGYFEIERGPD